MKKMVADSQH